MKQYDDLAQRILIQSRWSDNRTGVRTKRLFGPQLEFDMADGFPLITTKAVPFKSVVGELLGFIAGADSAADFRALGCNIWNANANDEGIDGFPNRWLTNPNRKGTDDLGRIYGVQWRRWEGPTGGTIYDEGYGLRVDADTYDPPLIVDQLSDLVLGLRHDPWGRRHIVSAWNPAELNKMALPPCHVMFQCFVDEDADGGKKLSLKMYQRSADYFLGVPFNIASYALLLHMLAHITGMKADQLIITFGDVHLYENQIEQMELQMTRNHRTLPELRFVVPRGMDKGLFDTLDEVGHFRRDYIDDAYRPQQLTMLDQFAPYNIQLLGYNPHPAIKAAMVV